MRQAREGPGAIARAEALKTVPLAKPDHSKFSTPPLWLQRDAEALHQRGPRPVGEIIWELIASWGPDFERELRAALHRYNSIPANTYRALRADRFPRPFAAVDGGRP